MSVVVFASSDRSYSMYWNCLLTRLWLHKFWNKPYLSNQAFFSIWPKSQDKKLTREQEELLRWNKKHFSLLRAIIEAKGLNICGLHLGYLRVIFEYAIQFSINSVWSFLKRAAIAKKCCVLFINKLSNVFWALGFTSKKLLFYIIVYLCVGDAFW